MMRNKLLNVAWISALILSSAIEPAKADWADDVRARTAAARARMESDPRHQELRRRLHDPATHAEHARLREQMNTDPHFQDFEKRAALHQQEYHQKQNAEKAARVAAAAQATQSPSQCIRAFQSAVYRATTLDQLMPYFSESFRSRQSTGPRYQTKEAELRQLKSAYCYPLGDEKQAKVREHIKDGEAEVSIEGKNLYEGKWKGVKSTYRLVPESRYWKIDGYSTSMGLTIIEIPKPMSFGTK